MSMTKEQQRAVAKVMNLPSNAHVIDVRPIKYQVTIEETDPRSSTVTTTTRILEIS